MTRGTSMKKNKVQRFRLTIANKLLLGFLSCGLLTILIGVTAVYCLRQMNQINNRTTERDIPLAGMTDKLIDALLAQELYGRRSLILKSPEMEVLFWRRVEEVKKILQQIGNLPAEGKPRPLVLNSAEGLGNTQMSL
jgi:phosphoglycerate-specific signal transduction histidine kinase